MGEGDVSLFRAERGGGWRLMGGRPRFEHGEVMFTSTKMLDELELR